MSTFIPSIHASATPSSSPPETRVRLTEVVLAVPGAESRPAIRAAFRAGEVVGIIGSSGSEKSALLRTLLGLLPPRAGRVRVLGINVYRASGDEAAALRTRIGFVVPGVALLGGMNVYDNVALPMRYHGLGDEPAVRERVEHWLGRLDLAAVAGQWPDRLTISEARRAALARAVAHEPDVVLLDEPFARVDRESAERMAAVIAELRSRAATVIIASAAGDDRVGRLVDRHVWIDGGSLREPLPTHTAAGSRPPGEPAADPSAATPGQAVD